MQHMCTDIGGEKIVTLFRAGFTTKPILCLFWELTVKSDVDEIIHLVYILKSRVDLVGRK